jgi:hypothetical protein
VRENFTWIGKTMPLSRNDRPYWAAIDLSTECSVSICEVKTTVTAKKVIYICGYVRIITARLKLTALYLRSERLLMSRLQIPCCGVNRLIV